MRSIFTYVMLCFTILSLVSCEKDITKYDEQIARLEQSLRQIQDELAKPKDNSKPNELASMEQTLSDLYAEFEKLKGNNAENVDLSALEQKLSNFALDLNNLQGSQSTQSIPVDLTDINAQLLALSTEINALKFLAGSSSLDFTAIEGKIDDLKILLATLQTQSVDLMVFDVIQSRLEELEKYSSKLNPPAPSPGIHEGHTYLDLGLSVMWASCNVGATKPEEYGNKYAWGELVTKNEYGWDNYKDYDKSKDTKKQYDKFKKYNTAGMVLELADDVAAYTWKGTWKMPTKEQISELLDNTTSALVNVNGVYGQRLTSLKNGNSIFLPAPFSSSYSETFYYYSSSLSDDVRQAYCVGFSVNFIWMKEIGRIAGYYVRPVCCPVK